MDGTKIGAAIADACKLIPEGQCVNAGGNLGRVFIAAAMEKQAEAISDVASALNRIAAAIETNARVGQEIRTETKTIYDEHDPE